MKDMKRKKVLEKMAQPSVVIAISAGPGKGEKPKKGWKCPECGYEHNEDEAPKKEKKDDGKKAKEESEEEY